MSCQITKNMPHTLATKLTRPMTINCAMYVVERWRENIEFTSRIIWSITKLYLNIYELYKT